MYIQITTSLPFSMTFFLCFQIIFCYWLYRAARFGFLIGVRHSKPNILFKIRVWNFLLDHLVPFKFFINLGPNMRAVAVGQQSLEIVTEPIQSTRLPLAVMVDTKLMVIVGIIILVVTRVMTMPGLMHININQGTFKKEMEVCYCFAIIFLHCDISWKGSGTLS